MRNEVSTFCGKGTVLSGRVCGCGCGVVRSGEGLVLIAGNCLSDGQQGTPILPVLHGAKYPTYHIVFKHESELCLSGCHKIKGYMFNSKLKKLALKNLRINLKVTPFIMALQKT